MIRAFCLEGGAFVTLRGPLPNSELRQAVADDSSTTNPYLVCWCKAPSNQNDRGFRQLVALPRFSKEGHEPDEYAEGVLLSKPNTAAFLRTADCPTVVLYEKVTHQVVITHAGRAAMNPNRLLTSSSIRNILDYAVFLVTNKCDAEGWAPRVFAYITGAICPEHFPHDQGDGMTLIAPFLEEFGPRAVTDASKGTLDLPWIITAQLLELGVPESQITHDGICTYEAAWLASHRRDGDGRRNVVAVTLLPR